MLKLLLKIIIALIVFSVIFTAVTTQKIVAKATSFCDKEVLIGKSGDNLIEKSKKAGSKTHLSAANTLDIYFMGGYRPVLCRITMVNGVVTAKHVEVAD